MSVGTVFNIAKAFRGTAAWLCLAVASSVVALDLPSPAPGTVIDNQAQVFYSLPGDQFNVIVGRSNVARARVGADYGFILRQNRSQQVVPSQTVQFAHTLTNTGNAPDRYHLSVTNLTGDQGDLSDLQVFLDLNGNGVPDAGEVPISLTPMVQPGEVISLAVAGQVPAAVQAGDEIRINLLASSQADSSQSQSNMDRVTLVDGALIRLVKISSQVCSVPVAPGSELTYQVSFTNSGDRDPLERSHQVGATSRTGVLIEDRLPADVNLVAGQSISFVPFHGELLVLLAADVGNQRWTEYNDWNGTDKVARLGLLVPADQMRPNQSGSFSFRVQVSSDVTLNTLLINRVVIDENGNGTPEFLSGDVCNTTGGPKADIRFLSPSFDNIAAGNPPLFQQDSDFSDTLRYRFANSAFNYDATFDGVFVELASTSIPEESLEFLDDGRRQAVVTVTSQISGQSVPLVVRETGLGSGRYRSLYPIVLSETTSANGQLCGDPAGEPDYLSPPPASCTLKSGQNDQLRASFFDQGLGEVVDDTSIVDPLGIVFNSLTLEPVPGVEVKVFNAIDNGPGGLQDELANDPFAAPGTPLAIEVTDAVGFYQYPFMFPGAYYMTVTIPADAPFIWPSRRSPLFFPGMDVSDFSYGRNGFGDLVVNSGVFVLDADNPIVAVDFPVDPVELDLAIGGAVACDVDLSLGDPIQYSTSFVNSGNLTPPERTINVDGLPASGVVIESAVPLDTELDAAVVPSFSPASAQLILKLYDGSPAQNWVSYASWMALAPEDRLPVRSIALLVPNTDLEPSPVAGMPGEGGDLSYGVRVTGNVTLGTQIVNQMQVDLTGNGIPEILSPEDYQDPCSSLTGPEPQVRFLSPAGNAAPDFATDSSFADTQVYALDGIGNAYNLPLDGIYVELFSTSIREQDYQLLEDGRRRVLLDVSSDLTGDSLLVVVEETAYASGIFRSIRPLRLSAIQSSTGDDCPVAGTGANYLGDPGPACVLQGQTNDLLRVSFLNRFEPVTGLADIPLLDTARVNPQAYVFWSQSPFEPVPGALVRFFPLSDPPGPDRGEPLVGPLQTSGQGSFPFPLLAPGEYYVEVESTDEYRFPSLVAFAELTQKLQTTDYRVFPQSYGFGDGQLPDRSGSGVVQSKPFAVEPGAVVSPFDIPVDPVSGSAALVVQKTADRDRVDIGGLLNYSVRVTNVGDGQATAIELFDRLPFGFKYVEGSLRRDDLPVADPLGSPGPLLTMDAGDLGENEFVTFSYVLQATSGAVDSDGVNRAQAIGTSGAASVVSNEASVRVRVDLLGVLSDRGIIFGKLFVDQDCNNLQSQGEWPVGGVALYMQDGTFAVTDENGQYSIYGIRPGMHSLKVDGLTLPEGLRLKPIDNRQLAQPDSRLVDLAPGEFHRADFAVACPSPEDAEFVYNQVAQRNQSIQGDWLTQNSASFDAFARATARASLVSDDLSSGTLLASGELGSALANQSPVSPLFVSHEKMASATTEDEVAEAVVVAELIHSVTTEEAYRGKWLWPIDDTSLHGRFVVAVRDRIEANLYLNGRPVSREQIGEAASNSVTDVQLLAWYGVQLSPGKNLLEVKARDGFGNERVLLSREFVSPGQAVELQIDAQRKLLAADGGRSLLPMTIQVRDRDGYLARGAHFVTLEATDGSFYGDDLQPDNPGFQVRLDRGSKLVYLQSSNQTGSVTVRATTDEFEDSFQVDFVAADRPLLVTGIASGKAGLCDLSAGGYAPTALDCDNGISDDRAALFMKGTVRGGLFLTLSYDSAKLGDAELLRDIRPEDYYPIFGDSSVRGYEAQSRSKLYARLELAKSYLQWGDFVTDRDSDFQNLGRVQRSLTGVSAVLDEGPVRIEAFAADVDDTRISIEIPGNGTAMLYRINQAPIVANSELIELVVRDRENPGLILSEQPLTRFLDYSLDPISGNLRFVRVVPTVDQDLNPVFIRIGFDLESGGNADLVAGVRASWELDEDILVGGSLTKDDNSTNGFEIIGAFAEIEPIEGARISISGARMQHEDGVTPAGNALYAELQMAWENGSQSSLRWGRADIGFTNSGSGVSADREEMRLSHQQTIGQSLTLRADMVGSQQIASGDSRDTLEVAADYSVAGWTLRLGGRRIEQSVGGTPDQANTLIAGAGRGFTLLGRRGNLNAEFERELGQQDRERWVLGATWQAHEKLSAFANLEQINSLSGPSALGGGNQTLMANFGLESNFLPSTSLFNEYRLRGGIDGRDLEGAVGIRGDYQITDGVKISPSIERIESLQGGQGLESTAMSISLEDLRNQNSRNLLRLESRFDQNRDYYGLDWSYVARVTLDWSAFVREQLSYSRLSGSDNELNQALTVGLALRPRETNDYHALYMYQWKEESGGTPGERSVHLLSTHQNWQLNDRVILSGRLGGKYESQPLLNGNFSSLTGVVDARLIWDVTRRIDFDIHGGLLGTNSFAENRYAFGLGLSYLVNQGLRVGVGYNLTGFDEGDLDSEGYNRHGFYIHAQYKFDERLFRWLETDAHRREEEQ